MILYKGDPAAHVLKAAYDLSSFGFFQRGSVQEFINFTAKIMAERTQIGERQSVKEAEYMCHAFARSDSLVGVCLSDHDYPHRVAHTMLTKVMEDFTNQVILIAIFTYPIHLGLLFFLNRFQDICGQKAKKSTDTQDLLTLT